VKRSSSSKKSVVVTGCHAADGDLTLRAKNIAEEGIDGL